MAFMLFLNRAHCYGSNGLVHDFTSNVYFESAGTILSLITLGRAETKAKKNFASHIKLIALKTRYGMD